MTTTSRHDRATSRRHGQWLRARRGDGGTALKAGLVLPLASGLLLVGQAWLLAGIVDAVAVRGATLAVLHAQLAGLAGLILARALLSALGERAAARGAEAIKRQVRRRIMAGYLQGPLAPIRPESGTVASTIVEQVDALDGFYARFLPAMVQAAILPIAFAAIVLPVDIVVALLFLVTAPLIPLFMALVGWGAQAASDAQADAMAGLSGFFADRLRGLLTIRLLGRADDEARLLTARGDALRRRTFRVLRIAFLSSAVLELFAALGVAGVALYIGLAYLGMIGSAGAGATLAAGLFCLLIAPEVYQPLRLLAAHYHDRAGAMAAVAMIEAHYAEDIPAPDAGSLRVPATGRLVDLALRGLVLEAPGGRPLLHAFSLDVETDRHLGIVGASGCGKSTLIETIAGLRLPTAGTIHLGGTDVSKSPWDWRAETICHIGQSPRLFHGTIADNIRFARPDATDADIRQAADAALVQRFASRLPDGLETRIGEGGYGLSGGQAHRVGLARLFLRDPALILLDEPTAHLDTATEDELMANILTFAKGRMLIMATHSAGAAARMTTVLRIADGLLIPCAGRGTRMRLVGKDAA